MKIKNLGGIRARFLFIFLISFVLSMVITLLINDVWRNKQTDYSNQIHIFNLQCNEIYENINENSNDKLKIQDIINENIDKRSNRVEIFVVDRKGNIILSPENNCENQLNINKILMEQNRTNFNEKEIRHYYIKMLDQERYVVVSQELYMNDNSKLFLLGIVMFVVLFFFLTYGRIKYIKNLSNGLVEISKGNLNYRVNVNGKDELSTLGQNINYMAQELQNLKERERQIEKSKDMFIASISHDLKTPLTSIIGYIKLMKQNYKEKDELNNYIDIIDNKANRLKVLINNLLEYSKFTSRDIRINKVNISLNEFMRQIVSGMIDICNKNDLNIALESPNEEIIINVDPEKMVRVFENIIVNAIRYSSNKSTISIKISKDENGALVSIKNEGKSIKETELQKIFQMFYRTDESRNNQTGGAGIGLAIAKSIVELHGGSIWAECEKNLVCFCVLIN